MFNRIQNSILFSYIVVLISCFIVASLFIHKTYFSYALNDLKDDAGLFIDESTKEAVINKDIDFLGKIIRKQGEDYSIGIFDSQGALLAGSEDMNLKSQGFEQPEFKIAHSKGYGYAIRPGKDKVKTIYVAIPIIENGSWIGFVRISTPIFYIEKTIYQLRNYVIFIFIFSIPISFLISVFLARSISHPLIEMTKIAKKISSGDLNSHVSIKRRKDEIGILVNTFNEMVDKLRAIHDERKTLFDNISHELMTPITTIRGSVETIYEGRVKDKRVIKECFELIKKESDYLEGLIEELQFISQVDGLSVKYDFKPLKIAEVILDVEDTISIKAREKNINIHNDFIEECPYVKGDYRTLRKVFINLLDNAVKYSSEGREIFVSMRRMDRFLKVIIEDQGIGIDPRHKEKIFERFYRIENDVVSSKGIGLGLSIVKEILNAHGTCIEIDSQPDKGSKFTIAFPIV
ncbi:MAG: HAMP domain-containing histidine kinase [Nitrospirae bacterium]|nr:HAMP domain-containing histidine kinase [Nitrospirota bacterium]